MKTIYANEYHGITLPNEWPENARKIYSAGRPGNKPRRVLVVRIKPTQK